MIFAIDVGNTNIVFGGVGDSGTVFSSRINTDHDKTEDEYAVIFKTLIDIRGENIASFTGAIISSVVPQLNDVLKKAVSSIIDCEPLIVGPGIKTGLNIRIDNPSTLGSDIVVGCVAACAAFPKPLIVIDMGTATTLVHVDKDGIYRGGIIVPGVMVALRSLSSNAALLQQISLEAPKKTIGTNTADCMRSGVVFGNAAMIDGLIDRMCEEIDGEPTIVATGGLAPKIISNCRHKIIIDNDLLLKGLKIIYDKNVSDE